MRGRRGQIVQYAAPQVGQIDSDGENEAPFFADGDYIPKDASRTARERVWEIIVSDRIGAGENVRREREAS